MPINLTEESSFVILGATGGQIFASQVGNIGLVGSFGAMAVGTPVIVVSGALAGAAIASILEGIENGDVKVLGITTMGSVLGAGFGASLGNVGVAMGGTAFGIGMGTMAVTGGIFALGAYQLIKMFVKDSSKESYGQVFSRMEEQISYEEFYVQALLELDPVLQELTWYGKFNDLELNHELEQLKASLGLSKSTKDYQWQTLNEQDELYALKSELDKIWQSEDTKENIFYSYPFPQSNNNSKSIVTVNLPNTNWQAMELRNFENSPIHSLVISDDSRFIFSGHNDGCVRQWDLQTKQHYRTHISSKAKISALAIASQSSNVFGARSDCQIIGWDLQSQDILLGFCGLGSNRSHGDTINCLASSPDGNVLASGSDDGLARLWIPATRKWKKTFNGYKVPIRAVTFGADEKQLVVGYEDGSIVIWETNNGQNHSPLGNHDQAIVDLIVMKESNFLVSASKEGTIKIWNLEEKKCWQSFQTNQANLLGISVNLVSKIIATATNQEVKLWQWQTWQCLQTLTGCFPVQFSPNGEILATYSRSRLIKIWQLQSSAQPSWDYEKFSLNLNWWDVLGVSPKDDTQIVKAAYYKLAKQYHPDQTTITHEQQMAVIAMQKINWAYEQFCRTNAKGRLQ
ncbi:DnaJ domain-containing protein [Synechocystis salina LEGE 06099]|uniref:DnaJ domain-containing protein n=1 Tax=Synechocystis salina TaxID=945780 RepID=UPI00187DEE9E|nr:DnaJ domain-containing protein [Synechocystis salina]MBE9203156.1 DnaJ domain-containing protein [Synechocystis salina LEGE 06099]